MIGGRNYNIQHIKHPQDPHIDADAPQWQSIYSNKERRKVAEAALVLASVGLEHHVHRVEGEWVLFVRPARAAVARHQLAQYEVENKVLPRPPAPVHVVDSGVPGVLGYLCVIWAIPFIEFVLGGHWRTAGVMYAGAVVDGEWWRTITALTLHADLGHLLANSLFGTLFGWLAGRYIGSGIAWFLIIVAAAIGNGANALIQADQFRSIGASTAVFASLGLVSTFVWRRGYVRSWGWRRSFAPVFAAIALVAYTGTGGENTDVAAHLLGFGAGAAIGFITARWNLKWLGQTGQHLAGASALLLIVFAWWSAQ